MHTIFKTGLFVFTFSLLIIWSIITGSTIKEGTNKVILLNDPPISEAYGIAASDSTIVIILLSTQIAIGLFVITLFCLKTFTASTKVPGYIEILVFSVNIGLISSSAVFGLHALVYLPLMLADGMFHISAFGNLLWQQNWTLAVGALITATIIIKYATSPIALPSEPDVPIDG